MGVQHETRQDPLADPQARADRRQLRLWRALALGFAAVVAILVFTAYSSPDLLINIGGLRYCG